MTSFVTSVFVEESSKTFVIRIGTVELLVRRSARSATVTSRAAPATAFSRPREPGRRIGGLATLGALATIAVVGLGMVGGGAYASEGAYRVVRPIPERVMMIDPAGNGPENLAQRPLERLSGAVAVVPTKADGAAATRPKPFVDDSDFGAGPVPDAEAVSVGPEEAIERAVSTGRLQQWIAQDGLETGFVVVGELDPQDGRCRDLSILTKDGFDSRVTRLRRCRDGAASLPDAPTGSSGASSPSSAVEPPAS